MVPAARFSRSGIHTDPGRFADELRALPDDLEALGRVNRGLIVHEHLAGLYGVTLDDDDRSSVHVRRVDDLLARAMAKCDAPLGERREPAQRIAGNCRHHTVLMVAMLRAHGRPARARCGFGCYFAAGAYEDHWVCESWSADEQRWTLVDAQLDRPQREFAGIEFDVADVPRDQFLVAGDAWIRWRSGEVDAEQFGLSAVNEFGAWWIAGNLMRDAAALTGIELLPWDTWGAMPRPDEVIDEARLELFDELARMTVAPDDQLDMLDHLMASDERVRVPKHVHNVVLDRDEPVGDQS
jgi:hypothetical protein